MPDLDPATKSMDAIVALCKRRGFVYPASEIYGGINGFWDYGPLGTALKNNIRDHWWKQTVDCPPIGPDGEPVSIVGLDSSIIQNPKVWEASGHLAGFSDPMQTCHYCKKLFRADHITQMLEESEWLNSLADAIGDGDQLDPQTKENTKRWYRKKGNKLAPGMKLIAGTEDEIWGTYTIFALLRRAKEPLVPQLPPCPNCAGELTEPRQFNLMFPTYVGAVFSEDNKVYLRPETAQGIFLNYKNILDTMRVKVPFGVAQIGKSFRNEVTPRNFIFRSREFEQMEMEWFCAPDEAAKWYEFWKVERMRWWESLGVSKSNLRYRDHDEDELAHYSKMCVDIEYKYPFTAPGFGELEGVAHRGCFDLTQHQEHSKQKLEYFDQERQLKAKEAGLSKEEVDAQSKYMPNVIEPASGLTRGVLVLLCEAFTPDESRPSKVYMKFKPRFAPIKAGIFPLVNKDGMPEIAQKLYMGLREKYTCQLDEKQSIGKRYARMDEAGTPYCFTIDGDTLNDQTVTVRDRDTQAQERISLDKVEAFLAEKIGE